MKNQRWPGDDQTIKEEFRSSRKEEQMGMNDANMSRDNDFLAMNDNMRLDRQMLYEMEPSFATQLDTNGMQPHSREYLERDVSSLRSSRKFTRTVDGQVIDHCDGIQFSGTP